VPDRKAFNPNNGKGFGRFSFAEELAVEEESEAGIT
jgi:hypothetical protein